MKFFSNEKQKPVYVAFGKTFHTKKAMCEMYGITRECLYSRLKAGWKLEEALRLEPLKFAYLRKIKRDIPKIHLHVPLPPPLTVRWLSPEAKKLDYQK